MKVESDNKGRSSAPVDISPDIFDRFKEKFTGDRYLYNEAEDRRFEFNFDIPEAAFVGLYARTYGGTWANLMEVGTYFDAYVDKKQKKRVYSLCMDTLIEERSSSTVPSHKVEFSSNNPKWTKLYTTGFYGTFIEIEKELRQKSRNGVFMRELRTNIDVPATIQVFFDHLDRRDFTQPPFVLKTSKAEQLTNSIRKLLMKSA